MNKTSHPRFNKLPDSILCHILSFLPTKHAATTSVLSKRWKFMWLSVFSLHFDFSAFQDSITFLSAVHSAIDQRPVTVPIHSFNLKFWNTISNFNQNHANKFVDIIMQRGIQNLDLDLATYCCNKIELPSTILRCRTLKILKLTNITMGEISDPRDIYLPCLKTLYLKCVCFGCQEHLVNILLGCPALEDLTTSNCSMKDKDSRCSEEKFKALPNLITAKISELYVPISMVCKAKMLRVKLAKQPPMFRDLPVFQSLTHLEIKFKHNIEWYERRILLFGMLKRSPKLQNLTIQNFEFLERIYDECCVDPPTIPVCLSSHLKRCCFIVFKVREYDINFAKYFIENSKVLDTMTITSICSINRHEKEGMLEKLCVCTKGSKCKILID